MSYPQMLCARECGNFSTTCPSAAQQAGTVGTPEHGAQETVIKRIFCSCLLLRPSAQVGTAQEESPESSTSFHFLPADTACSCRRRQKTAYVAPNSIEHKTTHNVDSHRQTWDSSANGSSEGAATAPTASRNAVIGRLQRSCRTWPLARSSPARAMFLTVVRMASSSDAPALGRCPPCASSEAASRQVNASAVWL